MALMLPSMRASFSWFACNATAAIASLQQDNNALEKGRGKPQVLMQPSMQASLS